ncbi:MAG: type II toxin-antitoxin system HigB family toxin [Acidobacteriota bacterium]|nr:type II toxin-antitoxin system HigB family toxin [Acidobacteriota bacterium]
MRIISERKIREYTVENSESENAMREWIRVVRLADWHNFTDLRNTFNHADVFNNCVIFDVGGNKWRIIAKVEYQKHLVFIKRILTHNEYSFKNGKLWKSDCE